MEKPKYQRFNITLPPELSERLEKYKKEKDGFKPFELSAFVKVHLNAFLAKEGYPDPLESSQKQRKLSKNQDKLPYIKDAGKQESSSQGEDLSLKSEALSAQIRKASSTPKKEKPAGQKEKVCQYRNCKNLFVPTVHNHEYCCKAHKQAEYRERTSEAKSKNANE